LVGKQKRHGAREAAQHEGRLRSGRVARYDFNGKVESSFIFGKIIVIGDNMMRLVGHYILKFRSAMIL
jgi:hypothetical protein